MDSISKSVADLSKNVSNVSKAVAKSSSEVMQKASNIASEAKKTISASVVDFNSELLEWFDLKIKDLISTVDLDGMIAQLNDFQKKNGKDVKPLVDFILQIKAYAKSNSIKAK